MRTFETAVEYALQDTAMHFRCFSRNGYWGTCGFCPRTTDGEVYPEFCENRTTMIGHALTLGELASLYERCIMIGQEHLDARRQHEAEQRSRRP